MAQEREQKYERESKIEEVEGARIATKKPLKLCFVFRIRYMIKM